MPDQPTAPSPTYFLSLSLENVRSFGAQQTISFARPDGRPAQWTIILGDNGVGKTTVLKALASVMLIEQYPIGKYGVAYHALRKYGWNVRRHSGQENSILSALAVPGIKLTDSDWRSKSKKSVTINSLLEIISPSSKFTSSNEFFSSSVPGVESLLCYGYGAGRTIGESTLGDISSEEVCVSLFDDRADLLNPEEWFLQADYRVKSDDHSLTKQNFKLLREALITVLYEVDNIKVSPVSSGGNPEQGLQFLTPYGWVRLRDMSLGYQTLVVWLTDFASKLFIRYPDSPNPLEEPAIVLIDEIDLHLHPSWQRKLIGFLSGIFKNTQFIATAHSPLVVQAAGDADANVVLLRREGDQTVVVTGVEDIRGWRVDQILTSSFYNLETARSIETEKKLERQATLLNKEKLTAKERRELDALTLELEGQPMGSTGAEQEEEDLLRELTRRVGKRPKA